MPKTHDYDDAEDYLDDNEDYIEKEYDKPFNSLSRPQQREALLDVFFNGDSQYKDSVEIMRQGLGRPSGTETSTVTLRGHVHHVERNANGTFKKWLD